jgi:DNA polymerase-3 subunit alpha
MTIAPNGFTHLHVHTEFSLLDGLGRVDDLVSEASALGFDSLAITDHGALYGVVPFYQAATQRGIKPIIGIETYVARRSMRDREGKADAQPYHLVLLAKNWTGYQNLCRLVTGAHLDGYYYKPRIDHEFLSQHAEGLIGMSACLGGEIPKALEVDDWEGARRLAGTYSDIFGPGNFYLEMQNHGIPLQQRVNGQLRRLAAETGLPLVASNDLHYVRRSQAEAHDVLLCIGTASTLDTPNRMRFESEEFYLKSAAEMEAAFPDVPEALANTRRIAEMIDLQLPFGHLRLPDFPVPDGYTVETWLRAECERGLVERYPEVTPEIRDRLNYELDVICRMGYAAYFLIVADFTRFAREQGIATTCRGSAPGSIVTHTLGITPVDPIQYDLPFERFLNPDRVTMPDIDMDFEDARRDEVINYVTRKYGADRVAQIITFGTMLARAAIRDVGRVLGMSYGDVDRIAKAVPNQLGIKLEEAIEQAPELRSMYEGDPQVHRLIDLARQVEGVSRNVSTHAAGVVISREPLTEIMPLQKATNSEALMTQYEMHGVDALGLLKFDFLGLSNLTILRHAVDMIREHRGVEIDLDRIPLDDARTFELLASGETTGVFQLESAGMRRYIRELRPTSVHDLAAMVALYRPGPMENIPAYIRRKHGEEPITYLHPLLEPYLSKTYGIFVYQEDIMAAAKALAGFSGPEADTLGYAIRKKKHDVLQQMMAKFVPQAAERGVKPDVIDAVFAAFQPFARYGFNKAHATTYGLVAYQTAYLKANYTVDYMASVLTAFRDNTDKVAAAVAECRRLGIEVRPPDVHRSQLDFTVEGDGIRFGLLAVKNVGQGAIESIIAAREADGDFRSLTDLCRRVDLRLVNKRVLESLIKVGALGRFGHPAQLLLALDDAMAAAQAEQRERSSGQTSLFGGEIEPDALERALPAASEVPPRERLHWEKELIGLYLSDHPLAAIVQQLDRYVTAYSGDLGEEMDQQRVVVGGVVTAVRRVITKSKATMGVATLEDLQGTVEVIVFPKIFEATGATWQPDVIVLVAGRVDHKGDGAVILADSVWTWEEALALGEDAFARQVQTFDRGRRGAQDTRRWGPRDQIGERSGAAFAGPASRGGDGGPPGGGRGLDPDPVATARQAAWGAAKAAAPALASATNGHGPTVRRVIPRVSPLRGGGLLGELVVDLPASAGGAAAVGRATAGGMPGAPASGPGRAGARGVTSAGAGAGPDDGPPPAAVHREGGRRAAAPTVATAAAPERVPAGHVLHVRFGTLTGEDLTAAFAGVREILRARPGSTPVVLEVPLGDGRTEPMELRIRVAGDAELLAECERRFAGAVTAEFVAD